MCSSCEKAAARRKLRGFPTPHIVFKKNTPVDKDDEDYSLYTRGDSLSRKKKEAVSWLTLKG